MLETSLVAQGLDENYQKAVAMLTSPRFKQAFDLSKEPKKTRDALRPHDVRPGVPAGAAVVEAGAKFVNVYFARSIGGKGQGWDTTASTSESVPDRSTNCCR